MNRSADWAGSVAPGLGAVVVVPLQVPVPRDNTRMQVVSILIIQVHPRDTQETRTTQLCVTRQLFHSTDLVSHTFELAGTRPNWTIRESTNTTHPSEGPSVVGSVDIATISSNAQQEDALLSILRAMNVNPEWDQRNWFDDVLRRLRETWPTEFADDMIAPFLDYTVRLLVDAPLD
ncbi:uncharacterized protein B0I36DRAFT_397314 [Microdochium trichocladiopsis]|uniref:Uncharacterized protein n=1 Tax=Microdochium trichocladiopsis TaxID=1682393 RepID=A0A9P8XTP9_9PEZI|nr:uncharacterized protein B0I36DRAFT_397314 [Microdochium trichocladiopsis]KAH7016575.1 hypothetical protein B0I36DRAFT_397314 [Microdochium trichocladiopsis]